MGDNEKGCAIKLHVSLKEFCRKLDSKLGPLAQPLLNPLSYQGSWLWLKNLMDNIAVDKGMITLQ